jgi:PhnB protein
MKDLFPPEKHERLINAHLRSGAVEISATDWMASPTYEPIQGDTVAIFVLGEGYDELKAVFDKLAVGVTTDRFQDLHDLPFGTYGQFCDKCGVHWIFKGDRVTSARGTTKTTGDEGKPLTPCPTFGGLREQPNRPHCAVLRRPSGRNVRAWMLPRPDRTEFGRAYTFWR